MLYGTVPGVTKPVARLVEGTIMLSTSKLDEGFALLDGILAMGGTTFDTAHGYGNGEAERTLGRWMEARGNRDQVVILSKGAHHNQDRQRVTPYDITADLHDSLARLRTDYIDLYILHRDDPSQPVGPCFIGRSFGSAPRSVFGASAGRRMLAPGVNGGATLAAFGSIR